MRTIPAMVDMRRTEEDWEKNNPGSPCPENFPAYFYGLSVSMENPELQKLEFSDEDIEVGDMVHIHAMAVVTSISKRDTESGGPQCRVEFELRHIVAEEESDEDEQAEKPERRSKLYG